MSRVARVLYDPHDPKAVSEHASRLQTVVDGKLEFGSVQNPNDLNSTSFPDGVAHNGTVVNLDGSWFSVFLESTGPTTVTCIHNLYDSTFTPPTGRIPVRWIVVGWLHDGTGAGAGASLDLSVCYLGGTIAFDRIDLVFHIGVHGGAITLNADHPMRVDLFFIRSAR